MRFIIILVLFSVIACASSHMISPLQADVDQLPETEEMNDDQPNAIGYNLEDDKAACIMTACRRYCLAVMNPPLRYGCRGNVCFCRKL